MVLSGRIRRLHAMSGIAIFALTLVLAAAPADAAKGKVRSQAVRLRVFGSFSAR